MGHGQARERRHLKAAEGLLPAGLEARAVRIAGEISPCLIVHDPVDEPLCFVAEVGVLGRAQQIERAKAFYPIEAYVHALNRSAGQSMIPGKPRMGVAAGDIPPVK